MLTYAQLEIAAKHYCRLMGLDPLESELDITNTSTACIIVERWMNVAVKISQHAAMQEAIEAVKHDH